MATFSVSAFFEEALRRRVFRVAAVYIVAAWVALQAADLAFPGLGIPESAIRYVWLGAILGVPVVLFFGWRYDIIGGRILRTAVSDVDADLTIRRADYVIFVTLSAAVAVTAFGLIGQISDTRVTDSAQFVVTDIDPNSIAVLPFVNMSGNPDNEYFSDGLTETLLHALAQLPDLKVSARTSSFFFKGENVDVRDIAIQLGVRNVLEGSVQRDGDNVRITAQLIEADTGFHRWSMTYDREMRDIFVLHDEIATNIAREMKVALAGDTGGGKIERLGTQNVAAFDAYLKGLEQVYVGSIASTTHAVSLFRESLALDQEFFEARIRLAESYWNLRKLGEITEAATRELVMPLLDVLLEERPGNGAALVLDARVRGYRNINVEERMTKVMVAIAQTPDESALYGDVADLLRYAGRPEEGLSWIEKGITVDPFDPWLHTYRARHMMSIGNLDQAEISFARSLELNPENPSVWGSAVTIPWYRKQYADWFAMVRKGMEVEAADYEFPTNIALNLYTFGLIDVGDEYLQRAVSIAPEKSYVRAARLYRQVIVGDHAGARDMSEAMLRSGDIEPRRWSYFFTAMVFASTMKELGRTDEMMEVLEEIRPGITSLDYAADSLNDKALQYFAAMAIATTDQKEGSFDLLDDIVANWEKRPPNSSLAHLKAPVEMARGRVEMAVAIALDDLDSELDMLVAWDWPLRYHHIYFFKALSEEPAVAERLAELEAEAKKGGEDIQDYIIENDLQL